MAFENGEGKSCENLRSNISGFPMTKLVFVKLTGFGEHWEDNFGGLLESRSCLGEVTLGCGSLRDSDISFFKGHKKVLEERSGYCRNAFKVVKDSKPVLLFEKIKSRIMRRMLDFLYIGHVTLKRDDLDNFMDAASQMGVMGIRPHEYECKVPTIQLPDGDKIEEEEDKEEDDLDKVCEALDPIKFPGEALISRNIPPEDILLDDDDDDDDNAFEDDEFGFM